MKKSSLFWRWGYLALIFFFLYAPIIVLMVFSFNKSRSRGQWGGFSLQWYESLFHNDAIMSALGNTFIVAIAATLIATILGTMGAIGLYSMKKRNQNILMQVTYIPVLSPDIVMGVSLMILFLSFSMKLGLTTLILAHVAFCTPYVVLSIMPKLMQMDTSVYEAALDMGAKPHFALRKVILPQLKPGIVTGALMAFTLSLDDCVISLFTTGNGVDNLSVHIFNMARRGVSPEINAVSTIIFVIVLALLLIVNYRMNKESKKLERDF